MIPLKINNSNNNIVFGNIKNTGKFLKAGANKIKGRVFAPVIIPSSFAGAGIIYDICKNNKPDNKDIYCDKLYINAANLKKQAKQYNEKEEEFLDPKEKFANKLTALTKIVKAKLEAGEELKPEDLKFSLPKSIEERQVPDLSKTEFDDDYLQKFNNVDSDTIEIADFKEKAAIIKNKQLRTIAETICKKEHLDEKQLNFIRDIDAGFENITDSKILKYLKSELKRLAKIDYDTEHYDIPEIGEFDYFYSLNKIAEIVDVYNTMTGKYSRYRTADIDSLSVFIDNSRPTAFIEDLKQLSSENAEHFINLLNTNNEKKHPAIADFESLLKTEALETLSNKEEWLDYMYEKYYLRTITDAQTKKLCREISRTYKVRVLLSNKTFNIQRSLRIIKEELENWTSASNGKARLPRILDLNLCDVNYEHASAYTDIRGTIHHDGAKIDSPLIIRHEIMHLNEPSFFAKLAADADQAKIIRSIIKTKKENINGREVEVLDWDNCKYREEFLKIGINPQHVRYAYTNRNEFLSVAIEGDLSQCSPEFKQDLIKMGMPEYAFNLQLNNFEVKSNVRRVQKILKKHPKASFDKLVTYIEKEKAKEISPEDKLLNLIFGKNREKNS